MGGVASLRRRTVRPPDDKQGAISRALIRRAVLPEPYGVGGLVVSAIRIESAMRIESIIAVESTMTGAGAGAIAGVVVSVSTVSPPAQAATESTAAAKARRFMTIS